MGVLKYILRILLIFLVAASCIGITAFINVRNIDISEDYNKNPNFNIVTANKITAVESISSSIDIGGRGVFGNETNLAFSSNTADATLADNSMNVTDYTGAAARTLTLPPATVDNRCVISFGSDPSGGVNVLLINCNTGDIFQVGSYVPTAATNKMTNSVIPTGLPFSLNRIEYTPTNDGLNFMSYGSKISLYCLNEGVWQVQNVDFHFGPDVTVSAISGRLRFVSF
jgi:hypothetical protein